MRISDWSSDVCSSDLLEQSARTSANKLKFFRLAFGSAGGFGELVPADEAKSAIQGIIGDRAITLNWMIGAEPLPKPAVKIILNLALLLVEDRKSTRLNSQSLMRNSYAVFCLQKHNPPLHTSPATYYNQPNRKV